jgi:alkylation response protein AidB-like acyl-CoA dehydrogenase
MSDIEQFRVECAAWLDENCPSSMRWEGPKAGDGTIGEMLAWGGRKADWSKNPDARVWLDRMAEKGWTAPTWAREYGGGGLDKDEGRVLGQEMARLKAMPPLAGFGLTMIGPLLVDHGTEEQKKRFLPEICRGEIRWCQGYSEPNSGSDLASLATRAELDGDDWVLNGQKVWTSYADLADWMFCLVRTDTESKHGGITFILFDMDDPGITVRPIPLISGYSPFCETFIEDVRVPRDQVVGGVNNGWAMAKALLGHERSMISSAFSERSSVNRVVELAREYLPGEDGRIGDAHRRDSVAALTMDKVCLDLTIRRSGEAAKVGQQPGPETSIFKYYATELNKDRYSLMLSVLGPQALGWEGEGFEDGELQITREWLRSRGNSIEGGTSEIQLNIIAKRVLGLPD